VKHIGVMEFTHEHAETCRPQEIVDEKDESGKEDQ
jgi:hypothetical protein